MKKINLYIVDIEEITIDRLEELFYNNPQLGIKVIGSSNNYIGCINNIEKVKEADVLLISAFLPDQMGIDLIAQVKKVNPNAKIIIMVNKQTRNLADVSKSKGADEIIQKPFKAKALIDMIENLIEYELSDDFEQEQTMKDYNSGNGDFNVKDSFKEFYNEEQKENAPFDFNEPVRRPVEEVRTEEHFNAPVPSNNTNKRALFEVYSDNNMSPTLNKNKKESLEEKPNQVVVFASTSSAGKTTMLVNTAVAIKKNSEYDPKICILDFNLLFPSVLYKFHQDDLITSSRNLFDLIEDINTLDETLINQALVTHEPTGIKIIETPTDTIRDFSKLNAENIEHLITYLRGMFDLILIDTSSNIREDATIFPLTVCDKAIVLLEPDLGSLLHTRKFVTMMKLFQDNLSEEIVPKLNFVLNKENHKTGIHVDTVKNTLYNTEVKLQIPEDQSITNLANNGLFITDKNIPSGKNVVELAKMVYPFDKSFSISKKKVNKKEKTSLLNGLFNKKK